MSRVRSKGKSVQILSLNTSGCLYRIRLDSLSPKNLILPYMADATNSVMRHFVPHDLTLRPTFKMSSPIFQLLYLSSAKPELTEDALLQILSESQQRNAARNITGLLLHSDGNLIQVIEGMEETVESLFSKIERDPRHHQVMVLSRRFVEQRDFPEYKMGFKRASRQRLTAELPGFSDVVENRRLPKATLDGLSKHVSILLKTFARSTRMES